MHGKFTCPVPCYYCPGHCASRKALQLHVKEAHAIVRPKLKEENEEEEVERVEVVQAPVKKKHIYPCRPCNKKFDDHKELVMHQQLEHNECENCFKYFSQVSSKTLLLHTHWCMGLFIAGELGRTQKSG